VETEAFVYKATERAGVARFEPRAFWATDDYSRSGSAADPARIPPGARVFTGVYATREAFIPFYYPPRAVSRLSIDPRASDAATSIVARHVAALPRPATRAIIFREEDRADLARHTFSVYAFDASLFRLLPTREYLSETAVVPLREVRHRDACQSIEAVGWAVRFVAGTGGLQSLRSDLLAAGVTRFSCEKL
jgi:hypothetical protein